MYLKLLALAGLVFSLHGNAQNGIEELFDDSIAIEIESLGGDNLEEDIENLLGKRPSFPYAERGEQTGEWKVDTSGVDSDKISFKNQSRSLINWSTIEHENWHDYGVWLQNRTYKDNNPDWKVQFRDTSHREIFGKLLKCIGSCKIYRGEKYVEAEYRSTFKEGDEILLEENSYAWIYLMDGSLLKLSPITSLSFNEINFSNEGSFKYLRLNYGNLHLRPWQTFEFKKEEMVESNLYFLPLMVREANREYYARDVYAKKNDLEKIEENLKKLPGFNAQFEELDKLSRISRKEGADQVSFIVTPVGTLESKNQFVDVFYQFQNEAWFRVRSELSNQKIAKEELEKMSIVYFRGYNNRNFKKITEENWYQMSKDGKELVEDANFQSKYNYNDNFNKRLYTVELARQLWIRKYTKFLLEEKLDEKSLAQDFGYRLWSKEEMTKRLSFLREYTRRVETTNLGGMEKVTSKIGTQEFGEIHYRQALKLQIEKLKSFYNKEHMLVKSMNDLDYYVWLLKNAD